MNLTFEIYKYFPNIFTTWIIKNIWIQFFNGSGQLVPSNLFTSFPQPVWIATDSLAIWLLQETVFNSSPNKNWKWNCKGNNIQIFASEIILAWENGSKGYHFGKYSISKLLKDLTQCAMFCVSMIYTNCIDINGIWGTVGTVNSGTHCNNRGLTLVLQMF